MRSHEVRPAAVLRAVDQVGGPGRGPDGRRGLDRHLVARLRAVSPSVTAAADAAGPP